MRYFYDTEFLEDGKTIDLISIGIVAEDGRTLYKVSNQFNTRAVAKHDWLMENVMSSISHYTHMTVDFNGAPIFRDIELTDVFADSRAHIAQDIVNFIGNDPDVELWAWYGAYDHVALAQLFGIMLDLPDNIPMYTNDIRTLRKLAGNVKMPQQPSGNHNALEDAKFNVVRYDYLMEVLRG